MWRIDTKLVRLRLAIVLATLATAAFGLLASESAKNLSTASYLEFSDGSRSNSPADRHGTVLWSADMATGDLSQWSLPDAPEGPNTGGGVFNSGIAFATVDRATAPHSGHPSAKLVIDTHKGPDLPTSGTRLFRWLEPQRHPELYYSAWYFFPRRYTPDGNPAWWNVFQWKSKRNGHAGSDPFFALNVGNRADGSMYFYLYDQNGKNSYGQKLRNIPEGRWIRVEAFYKCAGDSSGRVTFWQDDAQLFDIAGVQTRYPDGDCAWSVNNYSSSLRPTPATIYIADAAICLGGRCL